MSESKKHISRNVLAGFLVFWLSGVLFLICCTAAQTQASDKEFCPLAAKGLSHCEKAKSKNNFPTLSKQSSEQNLNCCGFLPAVFDKTRKIEKTQQAAQPAGKIKVDLPKYTFAENVFSASISYRSAFTRQNKIFIKNCVFRI